MCHVVCIWICMQFVSESVGVCFFFKQKTAYEMRISDWSSDVCSSDLGCDRVVAADQAVLLFLAGQFRRRHVAPAVMPDLVSGVGDAPAHEIGRASCRERVCQYV